MSHLTKFVLQSARIATPAEMIGTGFVAVEDGRVCSVGTGAPPNGAGPVVDLGDALVAPGFVDVHVHGGGGHEVNCASASQVATSVRNIARFHAAHGTTSIVATTVSDSFEALVAALQGISVAADDKASGVIGANLEGPWLSPRRAGAQHIGALREPSVGELTQLLKAARGALRLLTIAPELDGAMEVIAAAKAAGIVVAIGHTDADYGTACRAFDAGATQATHLFNAMAPVHQREPGPVAAALCDQRVALELVVDGFHVHPALIALVVALAPTRTLLVTDAIAATGQPSGRYRLGPAEVVVSGGRAFLAGREDIIAGSVLTMDRAVAVATEVARVPLLSALRAASSQPAKAIGATGKGRLEVGADADVVVLSPRLEVLATVLGGDPVYDPDGLLSIVGPVAVGSAEASFPASDRSERGHPG